jgi:cytosine permease
VSREPEISQPKSVLGGDAYATRSVPEEETVGWFRVALVSAMVAFSLPTFVTGAQVFLASENSMAFLAILTGCISLTAIAAICGAIGTLSRLNSSMLVRIAFGTKGAAIVNLALAISLLGWFGVNIDLFSGAVVRICQDVFGLSIANWAVELLAGIAMTVTTLYGFRAINTLSLLLVPVMMAVTAVLAYETLTARSFVESLAATGQSEIDFGFAVSSVIGGVIIGAVIMPDITRFIRGRSGFEQRFSGCSHHSGLGAGGLSCRDRRQLGAKFAESLQRDVEYGDHVPKRF